MTHGLPIQAGLILLNGSNIEKNFLVRTIWPKISWAIQIINPTFTWLHGLCQKMFQCEPFCLVEHSQVWYISSSICFMSRVLFLQVAIFPGAQIDGRGGERCSFQAALSNLGPSLLPCFSASPLPCICNNSGTSLGGASVNLPGKDKISKSGCYQTRYLRFT